MTFRMIVAIVLAIAIAPVPPATAADLDKPAAEVSWPLPWAAGIELRYRERYENRTLRDGVDLTLRGSGVSRVSAVRDGDGFLQTWRGQDYLVDASAFGPAAELMTAAMKAMEGLALEVRLDGAGAFEAIVNLDALVPEYRKALAGMFAGFAAQAETAAVGDASATAGAAVDAQPEAMFGALLDQLASRDALDASLAETPVIYNFIAGGGIAPGEHAFTDEATYPFHDAPVPRDNLVRLQPATDAPGHYDVRWTITPEPAAMRRVLVAAFEQFAAQMPELAGKGAEAFAAEVAFSTVVDYRVDGATGIVQRMHRVTRKRFAGREDIETATMTLL